LKAADLWKRLGPWRLAAVAGVAAAVLAGGILLASGESGDSEATPTPTVALTATPTAAPRPTPGPTQAPPKTSYRLVFRQYGKTEDVIWRVLLQDPKQRSVVIKLPHREGFATVPSLSPDGKLLAYLSLPDKATSPESSQADMYLVDLEKKETVKVAEGLDYGFEPLWSPDSRLIYVRRLAGSEFLNATFYIMRLRITHPDDPTPSPSPKPSPTLTPVPTPTPTASPVGQTPTPTPEAVEPVIEDTIARIYEFTPIGWYDDGRSLVFVQIRGGTAGDSIAGIHSPATLEAVVEVESMEEEARRAADEANQKAVEDAVKNNKPVPANTVTPKPTPSPITKPVLELSKQPVFEYSLSEDAHKVAYLRQDIEDVSIVTRAYIGDLINAKAYPLPAHGLSGGHHLRPVWHPDSKRVALGVVPDSGGPGLLVLVAINGAAVSFLPQPDSGFDEPLSWAPDGSWLAVTHHSGDSVVNRGKASLELVAPTGQRVKIIDGGANSDKAAFVGWISPEASAP
jgi:hypothetical protein